MPASGVFREQEAVQIPRSGQRVDMCPGGLAERHRSRAGLGVGPVDCIVSDVAPPQIEYFAPPTSGEREQAGRGGELGPPLFVGTEGAIQAVQFSRIELKQAAVPIQSPMGE